MRQHGHGADGLSVGLRVVLFVRIQQGNAAIKKRQFGTDSQLPCFTGTLLQLQTFPLFLGDLQPLLFLNRTLVFSG